MRAAAAAPAALLALGVSRLLPEHGLGLGLRLAAATLVVFLPGALVARALGRPGVSAVLAWTLAALFAALAVTFAVHGSLALTFLLLGAFALVALAVLVAQSHKVFSGRSERRGEQVAQSHKVSSELLVLAAGAAFGVALWHVAGPVDGDALFHLARVRKLDDFGSLSLRSVDEFRDGGLHPGYAFPLWHGLLALVARLAGVDPTAVVRHEASVLAPLALGVAYEAGWGLFRSRPAAIAVVLAQLALIALAPGHGGAYRALALPATAGRQILALAALALVFELVRDPSSAWVATLAVGTLGLALTHPTYALFVLVPVGGFLAARALLAPADAPRIVVALAALAVPTGAVVLWLLPIVRETASHNPTKAVMLGGEHGVARYPGQIDVFSDSSFRLAPEVLGRAGSVAVAALVLVPAAALAWRRRWAAYVLGGSLAVLALMLVPSLFTRLADAVSLSQARRAAGFLPLSFAFAGGIAVLAGLLRVLVLPAALAAGIALQLAWPGDFGYRFEHGGPALATWIAALGGAAALALVALVRRPRLEESRGPLVALAAALFVAPVAWHGFAHWSANAATGPQLTPGLVAALRDRVPERAVVFSDVETSYRISAFAPVYVAASPPAHVGDTKANRSHERARDAKRFFRTGDLAVPRRYGAGWIVVDRAHFPVRPRLPVVFRDARYTLYRL